MATLGELTVTLGAKMGPLNRDLTRAESRLKRFQATSQAVRRDFARVGRTLRTVGLIAVGVGGAAVKMADDFDKGVAEIATLTGGLTRGEMQDMKEQLMSLAEETGRSLNKLTRARYDIVSAGFRDAAESALVLEQAAKLAKGAVTDATVAADVITTALNAYELSAEQASDVSDILFKTVQLGKTRMDELGATLGRVIPLAAELGIPLADLGGALAVLTARGQGTDIAVTALRATFSQLLKPTDTLQGVIEDLGFSTGKALIASEGFQGALQQIGKEARQTKTPIAEIFRNVRAMQAAFPLTGDAADDFADALTEMEDRAGIAEKAFQTMSDRAGGFRSALQKMRNVMIRLGDKLLPTIAEGMDNMANAIVQMRPELDAAIQQISKIVSWIVAHGDLIAKLLVYGTIIKLITPFARLAISLGKFAVTGAQLVGIVNALPAAGAVIAILGAAPAIKSVVNELGNLTGKMDEFSGAYERWQKFVGEETQSITDQFTDFLGRFGEIEDPLATFETQFQFEASVNELKEMQAMLDRVRESGKQNVATTAYLNSIYQTITDRIEHLNGLLNKMGKASSIPAIPGMPNIQIGGPSGDAQRNMQNVNKTAEKTGRTFARMGQDVSSFGITTQDLLMGTELQLGFMQEGVQNVGDAWRYSFGEIPQVVMPQAIDDINTATLAVRNLGSSMSQFLGQAFVELADSGKKAADQIHDAWHAMIRSIAAQIAANAFLFGLALIIPGVAPAGGFLKSILGGVQFKSMQAGGGFNATQSGIMQYHPGEHIEVTPRRERVRPFGENTTIVLEVDGQQIRTAIKRIDRENQ